MKKFTKITLITAGVCAIAGIMFTAIGIACGGTWWEFHKMAREGKFALIPEEKMDVSNVDILYYEPDEVDSLDIELKAGKLDIYKNDGDNIRVEIVAKNGRVATRMNEKTLEIEDQTGTFWNNPKVTIALYLPEDVSFEDFNIEVDAGSVSSDYEVIHAKYATLSVGAGEIVLDELQVEETCELSVDAGSIELAQLDTGDLSIDTGVGSVCTGLDLGGNLLADCGVGSIELEMSKSVSDYNYKMECGVGDICIGNDQYSGLGQTRKIDNGSSQEISLECGVGSIEISFEQ